MALSDQLSALIHQAKANPNTTARRELGHGLIVETKLDTHLGHLKMRIGRKAVQPGQGEWQVVMRELAKIGIETAGMQPSTSEGNGIHWMSTFWRLK